MKVEFEPLSCLAGNFFQFTFEPSTTDRQLVDFTTALDDGQTIVVVGVGLLAMGHRSPFHEWAMA